MKKNLIAIEKVNEITDSNNNAHSNSYGSRSTINLPLLEGDSQIFLGQTIVSLIRLNLENDDCYSLDMQHAFKVELMASVIEELNISIDEIAKVYQQRNVIEE